MQISRNALLGNSSYSTCCTMISTSSFSLLYPPPLFFSSSIAFSPTTPPGIRSVPQFPRRVLHYLLPCPLFQVTSLGAVGAFADVYSAYNGDSDDDDNETANKATHLNKNSTKKEQQELLQQQQVPPSSTPHKEEDVWWWWCVLRYMQVEPGGISHCARSRGSSMLPPRSLC